MSVRSLLLSAVILVGIVGDQAPLQAESDKPPGRAQNAALGKSIETGSGGNDWLEVSRGYGLTDSFSTDMVDSVNLFNGNLVLDIPMGPSFEAGRISYGFRAVYNSRNWDFIVRCIVNQNRCYDWAIPAVTSNAGNGWIMTLGQLYQPWTEISNAPSWPNLSNSDFLYVAPDGSEYTLACEPNSGSCGSVWYSSDLQMRLRRISTTSMELDFPNGNVHRFEWKNWSGCKLSNVSGNCWLLTKIEDTYDNSLTLTYDERGDDGSGPGISVNDSFGRSHYIDYRPSPADTEAPAAYQHVIDNVTVNTHSGKQQFYNFRYSPVTIDREYPHSEFEQEPTEAEVQVPLLDSVSVPLSDDYDFGYITSGRRNSGVLEFYRLPTGAEVSFEYGDWIFPKPCDFDPHIQGAGGIPHFDDPSFQKSLLRGVVSRSVSDPWGPDGTTTYRGIAEDRWSGNPGDIGCERPRLFTTTVEHPSNSVGKRRKEKHYFSVATQDEGLWKRAEYGLPINKFDPKDYAASGRVYPSVDIHECDGASCNRHKTVYRRYASRFVSDFEFCEAGDSPSCRRRGSVLVREHENYSEDANAFRGTQWKDYDGLGNFRKIERYSGGFGGSNDTRFIEQDFNNFTEGHVSQGEDSITLTSGFFSTLPSKGSSYILNKYTFREIYDASFGRRTDFCFNQQGDIIGMRHRESRGSTSNALGIYYQRNTKGQVASERRALNASSRCDSPPNYVEINHSYDSYGRLIQSQFSGQDVYELDRQFNSAGHLIADTSANGVTTSYSTDSLGRPTRIQTGSEIATDIDYTSAVETSTQAEAKATQGDLTVTLKLDGVGRPVEQTRSLPDDETLTTSLTYDAVGNLVQASEGQASRSWAYDALGRVLTATDVDGSETSYDYIAESIRHADNIHITTTSFDAFGRKAEVELGKAHTAGFSDICLSYRHDTEGRLRKIDRWTGSCGSGTSQSKIFEYDGRGFLISRTTPEVGTVNYSDFDVFGNPTTVNRPGSTLKIDYNGRGLTKRIANGGDALVEYEYGASGCEAGTYCLGQVVLATRHNRIEGYDYPVETHPTYNGPTGQVSSRRVVAAYPQGQHGSIGSEEFTINKGYDSNGLPGSLKYPDCASCFDVPLRDLTYVYDARMLTRATGAPNDNITADLDYNSTGILNGISYSGFSDAYTDLFRRNGARFDRIMAGSGSQTFWDSGDFSYDDVGRVTDIGTDSYTYDALGRLTKALFDLHDQRSVDARYSYDAFDNLESRSTNVDGVSSTVDLTPDSSSNRLNDFEFQYDSDGNLTEDACRSYGYDALGMLRTSAGLSTADAGCGNDLTYHYIYDADNQRVLTVCDECAGSRLEVNLYVEPDGVAPGSTVTLSWDPVDGASQCEAFGGWSGSPSPAGGSEELPLDSDTTFGLRCETSDGESAEDSVVGDVLSPEFTLSVSDNEVAPDSVVTVQWSAVDYADECSASGNWGGSKPISGGTEDIPVDSDKTLNLTCTGPGGETTHSVTVEANHPEPSFVVTLNGQLGNGFFLPNETVTFEWQNVQNADQCSLTGGPLPENHTLQTGSVPIPSGQTSTNVGSGPSNNIPVTITFSCSNQFKTQAWSFHYWVAETAPVFTFYASPDKATPEGGPALLRWNHIWRANACWPGGWAPNELSFDGGQSPVDPFQDTEYSMTCRGPFGTTTETALVQGSVQNISAALKAPRDLTPRLGTDPLTVTLDWVRRSEGEDGFEILRRRAETEEWTVIGTAPSGAETFVDADASYATVFEYAVRATAGGEVGPLSNIVQTTTPDAPQPPYWLITKDCVIENGCREVTQGETINYGAIVQGGSSSAADFVIDNTDSSRVLEIDVDLSSSDWRVVDSPDSTLHAGSRTFLDLNVDPEIPGMKETTVTIRTNDPARPELKFTLSKNVLSQEEVGELTITRQPSRVEVLPGEPVEFRVEVTGGSGNYGYEWQAWQFCRVSPCAPAPIPADDSRYSGVNTNVLSIPNPDDSTQDSYNVRIWDKDESLIDPVSSDRAGLDIITVKILSSGKSQFVTEGGSTTLWVEAIGQGELIYDWYGPPGELVNDWNFEGAGTSRLTIRNAHEDISGEYSAGVRNNLNHGPLGTGRMQVQVVPKDVELADMFYGGEEWEEYTALNRQPLDIGATRWQTSEHIAMELGWMTISAPFDGTERAVAALPRASRDEEVEIEVALDYIAYSDTNDPKVEIGIGNFESGIEGNYEGIAVTLSHDGVLQIVRNGTEVLASGVSEDCGWNGCIVTFRVNTRLGTAEVMLEDTFKGDFIAARAEGIDGLDDLHSAFLGFVAPDSQRNWRYQIESFKLDMDSRPIIVPWMYQLL